MVIVSKTRAVSPGQTVASPESGIIFGHLEIFFRYLAVAETTVEQKATITVYDLLHEGAKKRKVLSNAELQSTEFNSIAFSPDSKYLAAQESVLFSKMPLKNVPFNNAIDKVHRTSVRYCSPCSVFLKISSVLTVRSI